MLKYFNRKLMVIYIVLMCVFLVLGCTMTGLNAHYAKEFKEATTADESLSDKLEKGLSGLLSNLANSSCAGNNGQKTNTDTAEKEEEKPVYDEATQSILNKKNATLGILIASFILTAVFMALSIVAGEYPKYLESDKYKAKLRRLEKAKKAQQAAEGAKK